MRVIQGENDLLLTCTAVSDGIAILRCETQDDTVTLPSEINGAPVTQLGPYALSERAPDLSGRETFAVRITCGGPEPVHDANAIRAVTLPTALQSVGSYAFYNCRRLETITLPQTVTDFGGGFTILLTPQMWMRDRAFEIYAEIPWRGVDNKFTDDFDILDGTFYEGNRP